MDRDTTQEDEEQEEPFEVLDERTHEAALAGTVTECGESDVAETVEDDDERDPDVPGVDIVLVNV